MKTFKLAGSFLLAGAIALAGCSGERGPQGDVGPSGPAGQDLTATAKAESCVVCHADSGSYHQAEYNTYTDATTLAVSNLSLATKLNADNTTYTWTLTFKVTKDGQPVTDPTQLVQQTFYAVEYDPGTATPFPYAKSASMSGITAVDAVNQPGVYTVKKANATYDVLASANAYVYGYVAMGTPVVLKGSYKLYPDVYNFGQVLNGTIDYVSTANVSACEACHGKPYQKHGYRAAKIAGGTLPDFTGCKACHTDDRTGNDIGWQILADDPSAYVTFEASGATADQKTKYAYKAKLMNDVHMSHAMEFQYPQSMSNCSTCHAGKLDKVLTDANFNLTTCKSCHPVTGPASTGERAPGLTGLMQATNLGYKHPFADNGGLYTYTGACNGCHSPAGGAPTFATIHSGYNKAIYDNTGAKYSASIKMQVDGASFDATTNLVTVKFSVVGAAANALLKPQVVASLYGWDTKDFVVSGHSSQFSDGTPNLEWAEGAVIRGTTKPANTSRLAVSPATATQGNTSWTATIDLSTWTSLIASGEVKAIEVAILPNLALDQTKAVSSTNPAIAVAGVTQTVAVTATATDATVAAANVYGKTIVDPAKCNSCHDTLGTTFHTPAYGSAGVVACRLCHFVGSGAFHLEQQSRSIDSFVHAIHSFQAMDVGSIDFTNPVQALEYDEHIGSTYPNFTLLNCQSCHNAGTFDVPAQDKSLGSILSPSATNASWNREITGVPTYVTGPSSRACGSCHRAAKINADDAAGLASFDSHTGVNGYMIEATSSNSTSVWTAAIQKVMSLFK